MALFSSLVSLYLWQLSLFHQRKDSMGKSRGNPFQDFPAFYLSFDKCWFGEKDSQMAKIGNRFFFGIFCILHGHRPGYFHLHGHRPWPGGTFQQMGNKLFSGGSVFLNLQ